MNMAMNQADTVQVVFVFQKHEQTEEVTLNSAQLTALLHAKRVWIEKFHSDLKIVNTVWSYGEEGKISLQVYLN